MKREQWRAVVKLARRQHDLITASQIRLLGVAPAGVSRAVADGLLIHVRQRVLALPGGRLDPVRPIRAVVMVVPDGVVSHRSAAWCHGLLQHPPPKVEITVRPGRSLELVGVQPHEQRLPGDDRAVHDGMPITTPARTLVDLITVLDPAWVERLMHDAVMRRLCEYDDVRAAAERAVRLGAPGALQMAALAAPSEGTTPLEARWARELGAAGLPPPVRQHQVVAGEAVFVLDFAWPDERVALEADGFVAHRTRDAFDRDHLKAIALRALGWELIAVTHRTPPGAVIPLLRQLLSGIHSRGRGGFPVDN